jgi:AcrR family transcriptional regulator
MELRDRILRAAAQVYAETGYRGATTRRIAQEAGVNEITLFRHFGSKDALIHEAIRCADVAMVAAFLPDVPRDPRAELLAWSREHLAGLRERRSLIRTCMGEIEEHPQILPSEGSHTAKAGLALSQYLEKLKASQLARASFDSVAASTLLMGVLFADAMGRDIMPDLFSTEEDAALNAYVDLFLRAIGAERN